MTGKERESVDLILSSPKLLISFSLPIIAISHKAKLLEYNNNGDNNINNNDNSGIRISCY